MRTNFIISDNHLTFAPLGIRPAADKSAISVESTIILGKQFINSTSQIYGLGPQGECPAERLASKFIKL